MRRQKMSNQAQGSAPFRLAGLASPGGGGGRGGVRREARIRAFDSLNGRSSTWEVQEHRLRYTRGYPEASSRADAHRREEEPPAGKRGAGKAPDPAERGVRRAHRALKSARKYLPM
jgi:hypothetical protein